MNKTNMIVVGVAWYSPDQYALLRALAADPEKMAETYDQWLANVTKTMKDMLQHGMVSRRVDVDVRDLAAWCEKQGKPLDGAARSTYAAEKLRTSDIGPQ